ncbi:c-type cytochrome [Duganella sp. FT80W]|uniref:C-type cytochrome n=2 Tax=Duganella guangzhouensis TaxID=2666084 RepID=A0A6I2KVT8_9BURK|nr:c-type cytochrome [Duganella guangzhouensis]
MLKPLAWLACASALLAGGAAAAQEAAPVRAAAAHAGSAAPAQLAVATGAPGAQAGAAAASSQIERGKYLATAGDCVACHTASGKAPFAGGVAIESPLGLIYSTNITPSKTAGIGNYTLEQFSRAVRHGVRADGSHLYPAMPYTAYAKLSDDDTAALYAYFTQGVKADDSKPPQTQLPFPFNIRASMGVWNALFLDDKPYVADKSKSVEWNRGAYLAQGLAHCSTCHTPRNFLMAEKHDLYLQGASLGTWYAPAITPGRNGWNQQTLADYLRTGHASNGATAAGPMLEAIDKSFSKLDQQDILALSVYLSDLPQHEHAAAAAPVVPPVSGSDIAEMAGQISAGEQLYRSNCASCHQNTGDGMRGLPALRNHSVLHHPSADNVSMAILQGVWPEHGQGMPGFANELSDREIAEISNYVMTTFGQNKASVDEHRVAALRQGGDTSPLLLLSRIGMVGGALLVLAALIAILRRKKKQA